MVDSHDLAYMAGIVDGEGHISLNHQNTNTQFKVVLGVTNTDHRVVNWIQHRWPGSVDIRQYQDVGRKFTNPGTVLKPRIQWRLIGQKAIDVIQLIRPWLVIKGEQADIAISFWELHEEYEVHSGVSVPQEYIDIASSMWDRMRVLHE